tara:strand:- start:934 stop:1362 length:429 start_codon:yes stop_codon:yes gene_type:complete
MNASEYKNYLTFSNQKIEYLYDDCPICYSFIEKSQNIIFGCKHNSCVDCCCRFLSRSFKYKNVPSCFICRDPIVTVHILSDDSKDKIVNIFEIEKVETEVETPATTRRINAQEIMVLLRTVFGLVFLMIIYMAILNDDKRIT